MLSPEQLAELRRIPSPTIANAIETFHVRPRLEGYTSSNVLCLFPEMGPMVGYAHTVSILTNQPAPARRHVNRRDYWESIRHQPGPLITVVQDLSEESGGAYWGEVNSNIHKKLGSIGVLTNGSVRDLDEVKQLGFHFFAGSVHVSHGYAHLEDFNRPVRIFGMTVHPGDLIHADKHGAVIIPKEIATEVAAASRKVDEAERPMIALCRAETLDLDALDKLISPDY